MKKISCIILIFLCSSIWASNIDKAYEALTLFDYFKAKHLFYKNLKKLPTESSFGLATIFERNDNPFSNIEDGTDKSGLRFRQLTTNSTTNFCSAQ